MDSQRSGVVIHLPEPEASFSDETRGWIADQLNKKHKNANFTFSDIIRVPKENGQFEIYGLRRAINQGSHSVIYKAYPISYDGEIIVHEGSLPVAVKFISEKTESDRDREARANAIEGLERESRALKLLNRGGGRATTAEGDYLIMPLYLGVGMAKTVVVEKKSAGEKKTTEEKTVLTDIVADTSLENKLHLMLQVCMQVQLFHDKHFTHGDLHPSNMLVTKKGDLFFLRVIDFDQSCLINNKEELIDQGSVRTAIQIRSSEVAAQKKTGAPSDIYALALNFLFLLGHEKPFASEPDKDFIREKRLAYQGTNEFASLENQVKDDLMQQLRLFNQKYPAEEIEKLYLEERCKRVVGSLTILPVEIGSIPLRLLVTNYIEKMLHNSPEQRPTIDEVNAFMRGVIYLIQQKTLAIDNSNTALARWEVEIKNNPERLESFKKIILEHGKQEIVEQKVEEQKQEKVRASESDLADREKSRMKLKSILTSMNNIENEINEIKGHDPVKNPGGPKKSDERKQLEANIKAIASMFNAESSANPAKDYAAIMRFLGKEQDKIKLGLLGNSYKIITLQKIVARAELAPEAQKTLSRASENNASYRRG